MLGSAKITAPDSAPRLAGSAFFSARIFTGSSLSAWLSHVEEPENPLDLGPFSLDPRSSACRVRSSLAYPWRFIGMAASGSARLLFVSRWKWWQVRRASPTTAQAQDQFFRLHHEEEQEAPEQQPRPDPQRDRFGHEQGLQRRRVSE